MAVGVAMGALSGSLTDVGIDDDFIRTVRDEITPETSALFILSSEAVIDKVHDEPRPYEPSVPQPPHPPHHAWR